MKGKNLLSSKAKFILFILVLSSFIMGQIAFAAGDGAGGGKSEGLTLVSSSIKDGTKGVSLKPEIKLTFSKNIVNMTVADNNKKCFSLRNENGTNVPINVIFADDQVDFTDRNNAVIIPKSNLEQGTTYSLVISSSLQSKSGVTTGQEIRITFTTEGTKTVNNNSNSAAASTTSSTKSDETANAGTSKPKTTAATVPATNTTQTMNGGAKSSTVQKTTVPKPKTSAVASVQKKPSPDGKTNQTPVTNAEMNKSATYQAANEIHTQNQVKKTQPGNHNVQITVYLIIAMAVAAALIFYFYRRKKLAK